MDSAHPTGTHRHPLFARLPHASRDARTLTTNPLTRGLAPIPASERDLPSAIAEPLFKVSDRALSLEGAAFDRQGHLLFLDIMGGRVLRLAPDHVLTTVYTEQQLHPAGIAVHRDGRIFLACLGAMNGDGRFTAGCVIAIDADGRNRQTIVPTSAGHVLDDMVFDHAGGFYMSDYRGTSTTAPGGIYYVAPDFKTTTPVLLHLSAPNGVALSPDGKVLWATEFANNRLHRVELSAPATIGRSGSSVPYHFVGRAPDSMRTDADGNVYVAMYHQARFLVFNPYGIPIGQILLPGRAHNQFLKSTSLALLPGSRDLVLLARDELGGGGAMVFAARGIAPGFAMFSHQ